MGLPIGKSTPPSFLPKTLIDRPFGADEKQYATKDQDAKPYNHGHGSTQVNKEGRNRQDGIDHAQNHHQPGHRGPAR